MQLGKREEKEEGFHERIFLFSPSLLFGVLLLPHETGSSKHKLSASPFVLPSSFVSIVWILIMEQVDAGTGRVESTFRCAPSQASLYRPVCTRKCCNQLRCVLINSADVDEEDV